MSSGISTSIFVVNNCGTPKNLRAAHPGNRNALKGGVYSTVAREERARDLERELASVPANLVYEEIRRQELASLLSLRDALDADLAANGTTNRRGEPRRQVDLRLRVNRQLEKLIDRMERETTVSRNTDRPETESDRQREQRQAIERWESMRQIAHGEVPNISHGEQIRASEIVLTNPRPRAPGPFDGLSTEEFEEVMEAFKRGERVPAIERALEKESPEEPIELARTRCLEELHAIVTGTSAPPAGYGARISAYKLYRRHAPEPSDLIAEELDGMTDEQLDDELRQLGIDPDTLEPLDGFSENGEREGRLTA
jgi:hypothetical protein